jgi:hypothetical protein
MEKECAFAAKENIRNLEKFSHQEKKSLTLGIDKFILIL